MEKRGEDVARPKYVQEEGLVSRLGAGGVAMMEKKYLQRDETGELIETSSERLYTIAKTNAEIERQYGADDEQVEILTKTFYNMMGDLDFLPGGRIVANTGTPIKSLANCYVLPVPDDLQGIYQVVMEAAMVHKNGGGTGYNFSQLRPRGSKVKNGVASGPVSFAGQFDKETEVINSGNRRGANMGILNVDHPDIFEFIRAKFEEGKLSNFNVSVGMTDEFMDAYKAKEHYMLKFSGGALTGENLKNIENNIKTGKAGAEVGKQPMPPSLQVEGNEVYHVYPEIDSSKRIIYNSNGELKLAKDLVGKLNENGEVLIDSKAVLNVIAEYAHASGEPGIVFLDRMEEDNKLKTDPLNATNPCGEQPLPPYGACDLGSINLANMVEKGKILEDKLEEVTRYAVRFLDNINDLSKGPIEKIEKKMRDHRRIGLGVMGWADMLMKMRIPYDSDKALKLAEKVMGTVNKIAKDESVGLGKEKGVFVGFEESEYDQKNPGERVRNLARTTIAPTGSISMVAGVNSGIEPYFGLAYTKQMRGGDKEWVVAPEFEVALREEGFDDKEIDDILTQVEKSKGSCQGISKIPKAVREVFKTSHDIEPMDHIRMQSAFQKHVDNAISKTINLIHNATVEDVLMVYEGAYDLGCKGLTVYRDGSRDVQVLETTKVEEGRPKLVGTTVEQKTPHGKAFITFNVRKDSSEPYEAFINIGKGRGDIGAISEGYGRLVSLCLKHDIPVEEITDQIGGIPGETQVGFGEQRICSLPDAFAQGLLEAQRQLNNDEKNSKNGEEKRRSGNFCPECAKELITQDGCTKCTCGFSKC